MERRTHNLPPQDTPEWRRLLALAKDGSDEAWAEIDAALTEVSGDSAYEPLAIQALADDNPQVRDLGASWCEQAANVAITDTTKEALKTVMLHQLTDDEPPYDSYRAAFALFVHGSRDPEVITHIRQALTDQDVTEYAQSYLALWEQEQNNI